MSMKTILVTLLKQMYKIFLKDLGEAWTLSKSATTRLESMALKLFVLTIILLFLALIVLLMLIFKTLGLPDLPI